MKEEEGIKEEEEGSCSGPVEEEGLKLGFIMCVLFLALSII